MFVSGFELFPHSFLTIITNSAPGVQWEEVDFLEMDQILCFSMWMERYRDKTGSIMHGDMWVSRFNLPGVKPVLWIIY